jgi:hypothetical protein
MWFWEMAIGNPGARGFIYLQVDSDSPMIDRSYPAAEFGRTDCEKADPRSGILSDLLAMWMKERL